MKRSIIRDPVDERYPHGTCSVSNRPSQISNDIFSPDIETITFVYTKEYFFHKNNVLRFLFKHAQSKRYQIKQY